MNPQAISVLSQIRGTLRLPRGSRLVIVSLVLAWPLGLLTTGFGLPDAPRLGVLPKHFLLHPGEEIHYTVVAYSESSKARMPDYTLSIENPEIVRSIEPKGVLEAVQRGRTELVIRTPNSERRVTVEVAGSVQPAMKAVPHRSLGEIVAKQLLFVGHANLDGVDHTAVAKLGIDRLVRNAKKHGWPVVYWVSKEYPNWYTSDQQPDYAIISEGQEHQVRVTAEQVVFTGGSFMFCLLQKLTAPN